MIGRFGHHPDPAVDYCVEVDCIDADAFDCRAGLVGREAVERRVFTAETFGVGGNAFSISARNRLREIKAEMRS